MTDAFLEEVAASADQVADDQRIARQARSMHRQRDRSW
jgi:hypothetical protein